MRILYHEKFKDSLRDLPDTTKKKLKKQIQYLSSNIRHPSLHAKKFDESQDIWQARVNKNFRFYFSIDGDIYILLEVKQHPK
jgi:mRNA interferase RelE/StbE